MQEGRLLNADRVRHILAAAEIEDALRVLYECGYNAGLITRDNLAIEDLLNDELAKTAAFFKSMCADEALSSIIMRRFDYHNLKALLKEKYGAAESANSFYPAGETGLERLRAAINTEVYGDLPQDLADAVRLVKKQFSQGEPSGKQIDIIIDRAMFADAAALAKKVKNASIRRYYSSEADLRNITTVLRMKAHKFKLSELTAQLVDGGSIEKERLIPLFECPPENSAQVLAATGYNNLLKDIGQITLPEFETRAEEYLFAISTEDKDNYFDSGPLFAWYMQKLAEIKTVKLIYVCKKNNIGKDVIKAMLKPIYR
jgi:V/A-type H+-transporting ATPase subunit C